MAENDILNDLVQRLGACLGDEVFPEEMRKDVVSKMRHDWGGDRVYIGKTDDDKEGRRERDERIFKDYKKGERTAFLARRYRPLSTRRIRQIIKEQEAIAKVKQLQKK